MLPNETREKLGSNHESLDLIVGDPHLPSIGQSKFIVSLCYGQEFQ